MDDGAPLAGKRILLLEDDTDARESMVMLLELGGADVVSTPTAEAALAALQSSEFDAVVTDVAMPGRGRPCPSSPSPGIPFPATACSAPDSTPRCSSRSRPVGCTKR